MTHAFKMPDDCHEMREVREGVDATDRQILSLFERRYAYMRAAARIKEDRASVRDERRKAEVIANAERDARAYALPDRDIAAIWDMLVESSIAYEMREWDRIRRP